MSNKEQDYAKSTFDQVAHKYDEIPFFKISARYVVEMIQAQKNASDLAILDVACGTGNVVLECASCLPTASFDAVDIAQGMLDKAAENATQRELTNITFHLEDVSKLRFQKQYDVITCSYALFFLPQAHKVLNTLKGLLKEDGFILFTTFDKTAFSKNNEILIPLLEAQGSQSAKEYALEKWENLKREEDIERLCKMADVKIKMLEKKEIRYGMDLDSWWELLNNTGYKGMLMELDDKAYESVKQAYYKAMLSHSDMDGEVELIADSFFVKVM